MLYFFLVSGLFLCVLFFFVPRVYPKLKGVKEKPMSDNDAPQIKFDVFVSFRGKDTRRGFLSHLADAFERRKINAFVDDRLERGDEIWKSLVRAIEGSSISLIIFSPDYASSRWCLDELVTIHECREKNGQTVIPVFYHVEPTNVRHQWESCENAFAGHEIEYKNKVQSWRHALNVSADLSGIKSSNFQNDAELVKGIVNVVLERLPKALVNSKNLVGIEEKIADVESLISKQPEDTRLIGIWGMGGIGKTTLAEQVFNKLRTKYKGSYFLANVREQSSKREIVSLKKEILSGLLGYDVKIDTPNLLPEDIGRAISCMKVLIVLDDVYDLDHIERFLGTLDNFGSGSRIIITTRDEQVLKANKADEKYQLRKFSPKEALELFHLDVFTQSDHSNEDYELSKRVVNYAKGNPLVLKVLARRLCGNKKGVWEGVLEKLKKMPLKEVYDVMKLSYDGLDFKERQIFLDLACFFLRTHKAINVDGIKSFWKDIGESDDSVVADLERLKDKALITFSEDKVVSMHDCLQEMAWEIVRQESSIPGNRSRLWDLDDIYSMSENDKGIEDIRSIRIPDLDSNKELSLHIISKMRRLQFLEIRCFGKEGLVFLSNELRFLSWFRCPLESLPDGFSAEKLVILQLQRSRVEKLWDGVKNLVNLKEVDLGDSGVLKELPDLSKATNLEVLLVSECSMLTSVHPSVFSLEKLDKLDLRGCESLTTLNMKELGLRGTKVKALAPSFGHQNKLKTLRLGSTYIERLPSSFNNLTQLLHLDLSNCKRLHTIAELPSYLETLDATWCSSLQTIPKLPQSLKTMNVIDCSTLDSLPEFPPNLETLYASRCSSLQSIPKLLESLKTLNVIGCFTLDSLPELPPYLETLHVVGCSSLQSIPKLPQSFKTLDVSECSALDSLPELPPYLETLDATWCSSLQTIPKLPQSLKTLNVICCSTLGSLPELPPYLETLHVVGCSSLQSIPKLPQSFKTLDVSECSTLDSLPELPPYLETLDASGCSSLQSIPKLPESLKTLNVIGCFTLDSLPELPPYLETLDASGCSSLQSIPKLPESLKTLNVIGCSTLDSLPKLPPYLETLHGVRCCSLQSIPKLSQSLEILGVTNCPARHSLPKLPPDTFKF